MGGLDISTLLLLLLLSGGGKNQGDLLGSLSGILRPITAGPNPTTGVGDPHFIMPWIKKEGFTDFHGTGVTANGGKADYRMYDNGTSVINPQFNGKDGQATIINEVGGRIQ